MKPLAGLLILALLMAPVPVRAEVPDDAYLEIFNLIQQADDLDTGGKAAPARAKYQQALTALVAFKKKYPDWNAKLIASRLNYLTEKVAPPPQKPPAAAPSDAAASATETKPAATSAARGATSPVNLLAAGAEPRQVLRLHPSPGDKQTLELTMKIAIETKMGEAGSPAMKLPALKMKLDSTVKEVADNGNITYGLVMSDLGVSDEPGATPELAEAMKGAFAGVKGLSGTGTVSTRGVSGAVEVNAPAVSNPQTSQFTDQLKEVFTQLVVPLPEEAVGPGAKWELKSPVKSQGMTVDHMGTYELVSLEGERVTVKTTILQQAANQKIQNPAMPGVKVDLAKMTGKGTGERTFDLAHVLPAAGAGKVHTETTMAMNMGGQKQTMTMKMDMDVRFVAK